MGVKVLNIIITWLFLKFWNIYNKFKLFHNSLTVDVILQHLILVTLKLPSWILCYKKRDICLCTVTVGLSYFLKALEIVKQVFFIVKRLWNLPEMFLVQLMSRLSTLYFQVNLLSKAVTLFRYTLTPGVWSLKFSSLFPTLIITLVSSSG